MVEEVLEICNGSEIQECCYEHDVQCMEQAIISGWAVASEEVVPQFHGVRENCVSGICFEQNEASVVLECGTDVEAILTMEIP